MKGASAMRKPDSGFLAIIHVSMSLLLLFIPANFFLFPENISFAKTLDSRPRPVFHSLIDNPVIGDYAGEIREHLARPDGIRHVNTKEMISILKALHVNTYFYLIGHEKTDWEDLKNAFLPAAHEAGIHVFAYLVPPSESGKMPSVPYQTDYIAWGKAIAELSLKYPNLVGWAIDDFGANEKILNPQYVSDIQSSVRQINPKLQLMPVMYFPEITPDFIKSWGQWVQGIILAYRDDPYRNTLVWSSEQEQIDYAHTLLRQAHLPLILMVYASRLSNTPASPSVDYVSETTRIAINNIKTGKLAGIVMYCLPKTLGKQPYERTAWHGWGHLNFSVDSAAKAGDFIASTQTVYPDSAGHYTLQFYTKHDGTGKAGDDYRQILIDNQIVWQEDVSQDAAKNRWSKKQVDLTPYLMGKKQAQFTLRLYVEKSKKYLYEQVGFDSLSAQGFSLTNPDFETSQGWTIISRSPGLIGKIIIDNPYQTEQIFHAVASLFGAFNSARGTERG
jgi:hypothetical protein